MNRRRFFRVAGVLGAAVVVAPAALAEMRFIEEPDAYCGPWITLEPTDQLDTFDPTREYAQVMRGTYQHMSKIQQTMRECLERDMKQVVPPGYRHRVRYMVKEAGLGRGAYGSWCYTP